MNLSFPQLLFASVGALLLYSAVTGNMPNAVIKKQMGTGGGTNPIATGQASANGSSGHQWDMGNGQVGAGPAAGTSAPASYSYSSGAQNVSKRQVWPQ